MPPHGPSTTVVYFKSYNGSDEDFAVVSRAGVQSAEFALMGMALCEPRFRCRLTTGGAGGGNVVDMRGAHSSAYCELLPTISSVEDLILQVDNLVGVALVA